MGVHGKESRLYADNKCKLHNHIWIQLTLRIVSEHFYAFLSLSHFAWSRCLQTCTVQHFFPLQFSLLFNALLYYSLLCSSSPPRSSFSSSLTHSSSLRSVLLQRTVLKIFHCAVFFFLEEWLSWQWGTLDLFLFTVYFCFVFSLKEKLSCTFCVPPCLHCAGKFWRFKIVCQHKQLFQKYKKSSISLASQSESRRSIPKHRTEKIHPETSQTKIWAHLGLLGGMRQHVQQYPLCVLSEKWKWWEGRSTRGGCVHWTGWARTTCAKLSWQIREAAWREIG